MRERCCLCDQIAGIASNDLLHAHLGGRYERRALQVGRELSIMPSLGSIVPGHLLLCPDRHVRSLAQLPPAELHRAEAALKWISARLEATSAGPVQYFEHGDAKRSIRVSCSVDHAHLHVVPGLPNLWELAADALPWRPVDGLGALQDVAGDGEYLVLRGLTGGWQVALAPPGGYPSQLLRRVAAQAVGRGDSWNWRTDPELDFTEASWRIARELASS